VLLGNLLRNAFSYTDAGEVAVEVGAASVVIRDTGVGIAPGQVDAMYQPFVRGDTAGAAARCRAHDRAPAVGPIRLAVSIDSRPGVGTRVEIRFPQARSEPLGA